MDRFLMSVPFRRLGPSKLFPFGALQKAQTASTATGTAPARNPTQGEASAERDTAAAAYMPTKRIVGAVDISPNVHDFVFFPTAWNAVNEVIPNSPTGQYNPSATQVTD
jgi:hypothetical protein